MNTKRVNLLAGTILGGALLLGTAGLVFAQDPTSTPGPSSVAGMGGQGMMGGGMGAGQMPDMAAMHAAMGQDATCDPKLMQSMHEQYHPTR